MTYISSASGLSAATILIVRHAEKAAAGAALSPAGEMRAREYRQYFQHCTLEGTPIHIEALVAAEDSPKKRPPSADLGSAKCLAKPFGLVAGKGGGRSRRRAETIAREAHLDGIVRLQEDPSLIRNELDRRLAAAQTSDPARQRASTAC
jgi:hypothetical protein